ncbi:hypothetical protein Ahy_B02g059576 isoform A [Arachis hypogaea]|uniref:Uncharacterized protein n=1 Tax=Arachis hypogaea TaxID=3818 RepID=A0A445AGV2_ARAHY|nr:hypothetical protein Ahy_B02g059576 isoform A [Arachis hypogaea]
MQNASNSSQNDFHGDTYNSSGRNHPNLRWGDNQNHWQKNNNSNHSRNTHSQNHPSDNTNQYMKPQNTYQPPHNNSQSHQNNFSTPPFNSQNAHLNTPNNFQQKQSHPIIPPIDHHETRISSLEAAFQYLAKGQETLIKGQERHETTMKNLERQLGQLAKQAERPTNVLPNDTISNPRNIGKAIKWEECKAITLRSGKKVETEAITQEEHNKEGLKGEVKEQKQEQETSTQSEKLAKKEAIKAYQPMIPYPQRLKGENKEK